MNGVPPFSVFSTSASMAMADPSENLKRQMLQARVSIEMIVLPTKSSGRGSRSISRNRPVERRQDRLDGLLAVVERGDAIVAYDSPKATNGGMR